jgi:rhodanese-related sulfurtransferase
MAALTLVGGIAAALGSILAPAPIQAASIHGATLEETGQKTAEVSTEEVRGFLQRKDAVLLDARPFLEFAVSHIPGALNVAPKPGVPMSMYVSDVKEIGRLLRENKDAAIVLYCNGPFCGKSKRLAEELLDAGYKNVRRYRLGIPIWRALGGVTEIEPAGLRYVVDSDRTAVLIDVRAADAHSAGSLPGARNLPRSGVTGKKDEGDVKRAKDDGRLPMEDHNTRIIVFGDSAEGVRFVAEAIAREAFHNVAYFAGRFQEARAALGP